MKNLSILFLLITISSCNNVKIKDSEWCGDLGEYGATCNRMFSDNQRELDKATWDEERFGMICGKPEAFADIKQAIQKLCHKNKKCEYEQIKKITKLLQGLTNEIDNHKNPEVSSQE